MRLHTTLFALAATLTGCVEPEKSNRLVAGTIYAALVPFAMEAAGDDPALQEIVEVLGRVLVSGDPGLNSGTWDTVRGLIEAGIKKGSMSERTKAILLQEVVVLDGLVRQLLLDTTK